MSKRVLITGATSGIGRATANEFARQGWSLILTGRRSDRLKHIAEDIVEKHNVECQHTSFDIRDTYACLQAVEALDLKNKGIDLLINNAGLAKGLSSIEEGILDHWEQMIDTNIKGLLYMTRLIAPIMVDQGHGMIINTCSTAGKEVYPRGNVYCATKHAVDALTKGMRIDLHSKGIRVGQVSPAHVEETEFAKVRFDGDEQKAKIYEDFNPLTSQDVAEAIYFMASRPAHVNVQDILLMGTQQANSLIIDRTGRKYDN